MERLLLLLLALASSLSACNDLNALPTEKSRQGTSGSSRRENPIHKWEAPPDYSFRVRSGCGEQNFIGTFHLVVTNGKVAEAKGLDESGTTALRYLRDEVPTLVDLHRYAMEAQEADADVVEVDYDPSDGHPQKIEIDYEASAIDDESCFVVTDYRAR
jgi:hypothetical protein